MRPIGIAPTLTRRAAASAALLALAQSRPRAAHAADGCAAGDKADFQSLAFGKENYASAVTASRDTNVSPKEAYDVIALEADYPAGVPCATALDLGAGAGVSTQILWRNGFRNIVAVDPSRVAWDANVVKSLPPGVQFVQAQCGKAGQHGVGAFFSQPRARIGLIVIVCFACLRQVWEQANDVYKCFNESAYQFKDFVT